MSKKYIFLIFLFLPVLLFAHSASSAVQTHTFKFPDTVQMISNGSNWIAYCSDPATITNFCKAKGYDDYVNYSKRYIGPRLDNDLVYKWKNNSFVQVGGFGCPYVADQSIVCKSEVQEQPVLISSSAPASVNLGDTFQIKCSFTPFNLPCITAVHTKGVCSLDNFNGTTAVFNCTAKEVGLQKNYCGIFYYPQDSRCSVAQTDEIQPTNVLSNQDKNTETNLILNPSIEGTTLPSNWQSASWGTNDAVFNYPVSGHTGNAAEAKISSYTDGDAKWYFDDVKVDPGKEYIFSDFYKSSASTIISVRYTLTNGTNSYFSLGSVLPSSDWKQTNFVFTVPVDAVSLTIFHLIGAVGFLDVDDFSLQEPPASSLFNQGMVSINFDDGWTTAYQNGIPLLNKYGIKSTNYIITSAIGDTVNGYMTLSQILDLQSQGHEIESHSITHPDLTTLTQAQATNEIEGSKTALESLGVNPVTSFDYPYGAWNASVEQLVKNAGYLGARTADNYEQDIGFNYFTDDPYALKTEVIQNVTPFATVKQWIDQAVANKTWLILVFHKVDSSGEQYSTTLDNLNQIASYLTQNNVKTVKISEGLSQMAN